MSKVLWIPSASGAGTAPITREFTGNGVWSKPTSPRFIGARVILICGGGGGGSGSQGGLSYQLRPGGGGGPGGSVGDMWIPESALGSTVAVTIGAGGIGGASQTSANANGNVGLSGGKTSFGTHFPVPPNNTTINGGQIGVGTSNGGAYITYPAGCWPWWTLGSWGGYAGVAGGGGNAAGKNARAMAYNLVQGGCAGGGGGTGIQTDDTPGGGTNPGGGIVKVDGTVYAGPVTGNGSDNVLGYPLNIYESLPKGFGTGGAGGVYDPIGGSIEAGDGGLYGAGGGGGYSTHAGTPSGKGGDGAPGIAWVIEYYS